MIIFSLRVPPKFKHISASQARQLWVKYGSIQYLFEKVVFDYVTSNNWFFFFNTREVLIIFQISLVTTICKWDWCREGSLSYSKTNGGPWRPNKWRLFLFILRSSRRVRTQKWVDSLKYQNIWVFLSIVK